MSKSNSDEIELYFKGDEYFRACLNEISKAQTEVLLESYIFDLDPIGQRFLDALQDAAKRGALVKVLVDGIGSFNWLDSVKSHCEARNISFRVYHPLPFRQFYIKKISWKMLRRLLLLFRRLNKRNHRKVIIVDRKVAFLGSQNISQVHSDEFMGIRAWRDSGLIYRGPEIRELRESFLTLWNRSKFGTRSYLKSFIRSRTIRKYISGTIHLNSSLRARFFLNRALKRRIRSAQRRILITNAYFLPTSSLLRSLRLAALRGVKVVLCLPAISDVKIVQLASRSLYERLLKDNVEIYEYQPRVLHAKTMIIDDWASVGSFNLNHRSLNHDLEVEACFTRPELIEQLNHQWNSDIRASRKVTLAELGRHAWYETLLFRMAYWLRYWL